MPATTPTLTTAADETAVFTLMGSNPGALDQALIQIDSGNAAPTATGTAKVMVKIDSDAEWALEPTGVFPIAANTSVILRLPKYPYAKVVLVSTTDVLMVNTVHYR